MPKKRERTTTEASWTTETVQAALNSVASGESMRMTAMKLNIPFSTIKDRVKAGKCYGPSLEKNVFSTKTKRVR
jgi:transposase